MKGLVFSKICHVWGKTTGETDFSLVKSKIGKKSGKNLQPILNS